MQVKPIIFSAPMIRALLEGRKSQTRRDLTVRTRDGKALPPSTHYAPGDLLWVRETCSALESHGGLDCVRFDADQVWRPIENTPEAADRWLRMHHYGGKRGATVPSIHMPRWASRLTLEVTEVRVQRLQEMEGQHPSESDAIAEGVNAIHHGDGAYYYSAFRDEPHPKNWCDPTDAFRELWNSLHGPKAWDANPWVAAIIFTTHHKNVDQMLTEREAA